MLWVTADDPTLFQACIPANGMTPCSSPHYQREWLWRFKKEKQPVPQIRLPEEQQDITPLKQRHIRRHRKRLWSGTSQTFQRTSEYHGKWYHLNISLIWDVNRLRFIHKTSSLPPFNPSGHVSPLLTNITCRPIWLPFIWQKCLCILTLITSDCTEILTQSFHRRWNSTLLKSLDKTTALQPVLAGGYKAVASKFTHIIAKQIRTSTSQHTKSVNT